MMVYLLQLVIVFLSIACTCCLSTTQNKAASSIGEAIQLAVTQEELLVVASQFWLPTDAELPPHLRSQRVHHEKRQRWSAQLLEKMASSATTASGTGAASLEDDRLQRAVLAASIPFDQEDRPTKEGRYVHQALCGLHTLVGRLWSTETRTSVETLEGIQQLIDRADAMAASLPLPHVIEMRFAARGLLARLFDQHDNLVLHNMDQRVSNLPFDITPRGVDWEQVATGENSDASVIALREAIPFHFDTITTRTGAAVVERRGTAWVAESGIGALAYSGKLMPPKALPTVVFDAMRAVETAIGMPADKPFFDCALCNHYPDAEAACKFHTDPEHGTVWERLTCVVAAGDCRRFAFRPIPGMTQWSNWENGDNSVQQEETLPAVIHLFSGDIVQLWGECNDRFHHAVYTAEGDNRVSPNGRVSLVLKRAIERGGGTRGHGLQGEGRRSKRNKGTPLSALQVSDKPSSNRRRRRRT